MTLTEPRIRADLSALRIDREEEEPRFPIVKSAVWLVVLGLLAAAAFVAYQRLIVPRRMPAVETITVRPTVNVANPPLLSASGYLVADRQANISATLPGRALRVNFDLGSIVKKGDVLVVIDSAELNAQLEEARANLADARREHARHLALWRDGVTARALLDSADARTKMAAARVERIAVNLRDTSVRTPFDGTVIAKNVEVGEMVSSVSMGQMAGSGGGGSLATIADLSTLEVEADVNENNVGQLRVGQPAEISVDAFPGEKWRGVLRQIVPTANRAKGVVQVKVAIEKVSGRLSPEMSASVSFLQSERSQSELAERPKIWLPRSAVVMKSGSARVVTIDKEKKVAIKPVSLGTEREERIEIVSGLTEGDRVIAVEPGKYEEGQTVRLAGE